MKKVNFLSCLKKAYFTLSFLSLLVFSCCYSDFDIDEEARFDTHDTDTFSITYPDPHQKYLVDLKKNYRLESKIASCKSDLQKVQVISHWVHELWIHHSSHIPTKNDPISIIEAAKDGKRFRCVEYSIVLAGCLNSVGLPARVVGLTTSGQEESHVVCEAYLWDIQKWIMADGQWDAMPVLNNKPMHVFELYEALKKKNKDLHISSLSCVDKWNFSYWIAPYLYHFDYSLNTDAYWIDNLQHQHLILEPANSVTLLFESSKNVYRTSNPNAPYKAPQLKK